MRITKYIFVLMTVLFFSCKPEEVKTEETVKADKKDSLLEKINSPELKEVNVKLHEDPNNAELYNKRARIYISYKLFEEAAGDALRAMKLDSTKAEYYVTCADVYFATNRTRYSKDMLESAVKKFPDNTEALLKLAELLYLVKQYERSIEYINKALKIDENMAKAYFLKGSVYKESGDTAKAISSISTAIEQDNKYFDAFYDMGVIYAARRNPIAFEYYDNALRLKPNSEMVLYAKAKLLQDLNKTDESIALYEAIIKVNKSNENVLYNLGAISLYKKKDTHKAIDYFSKALNANPKNTEAFYARGVCYMALKDFNNATADFRMCLQISKNYEPAIEALNDIEKKKR